MTAAYAVMPDVVLLARNVLLANTAVMDALGDDAGRVVTVSPEDVSTAWIRLRRVGGGRSLTAPMRLTTAHIQVDAFVPPTGPSAPLYSGDLGAMKLAQLAEAALFDAANFELANVGVICRVEEPQGPQSMPDTSRTPPTPRVFFTVVVTARPT